MSETITFVNTSDKTVKGSMLGIPDVEPGGEVELPIALCAPGRLDNGSRAKSAVEQCCPQLLPKDPVFAQEWLKPPQPAPVVSRIVAVSPRQAAVPAGVVAAREAAAKAKAAPAQAPVASKPALPAAKPAAPKAQAAPEKAAE